MNFLKKIFKIKHVRSLGRAGLIYFDGKNEFYIDSNNLLGESHDIEIFYKDIRLMKKPQILTDIEKKRIAVIVQKKLQINGVHVDITPPLSEDDILSY